MKSSLQKNILSLSMGAGLVVAFSQTVMARPPHRAGHPSGGSGRHGQLSATSILDRMDFDGNGEVTVDDFVSRTLGRADKHFSRLDKDGDELVSVDEFTGRPSRPMLDDSIDKEALKECIAESTGISVNERLEPAQLFDEIDVDDDGSLTIDEFMAHKAASATERFNKLDTDEDGVISEDEITARMDERKILHEVRKNCVDELSVMEGV